MKAYQDPRAFGVENVLTHALMLRPRWEAEILLHGKSWELRGSRTHRRGWFAIARSGSSQVTGIARLVGCQGPLSWEEFRAGEVLHHVPPAEFGGLPYTRTYAWMLEDAFPLPEPVRYTHPAGAVIWVRLEPSVVSSVLQQVPRSFLERGRP